MLCSLLLSLAAAPPQEAAEREPVPVLLVSGANNHDWRWTTPFLKAILERDGLCRVEVTTEPSRTLADREGLRAYQAFVLDYNGPRWGEEAERNFVDAVRAGTGVVVIHAANNAFPGWKEYEEIVALCWREGTGHGRFHAFDVRIRDRDHPVTRNLDDLVGHPDELYHRLVPMHGTDYRVLATAWSDPATGGTGRDEPMILVKEYGAGRVFHTPLGHVWRSAEATHASYLDPAFQELVRRGTEWAATGEVREPAPNTLTPAERRQGWELLFDGRSLAGWRGWRREGPPPEGWSIEDGSLAVQAGGGDLLTVRRFRDFEFSFEWKCSPGANSGVMYHVGESLDAPWMTGPEFQILDDAGAGVDAGDPHSAGALYAIYPPRDKVLRPAGAWNRGRIVVHRGRVEHWVNGTRVVEARLDDEVWRERVAASKFRAWPEFGSLARGSIALQDHGNRVWFRNLKIRELRPEPAGPVVELFNGRDLEGWTFFLQEEAQPEEVWSVRDGVLVCRGRPIGYLKTERSFANYILELDWRFDPEKGPGNSGVLLRLSGEDRIWPRSIEAQLMSGQAGDFWNIGEFPMRTDPRRTRGRNTRRTHSNERPLGQWNHYEILLDQDSCVLKVNGEVLNVATGCEVLPGPIGLQSEGAEIHFRNIRLTPLPD